MNIKKKMITVLKKAGTYFVVGTGIVVAVTAVVAAFVATFPIGVGALVVLGGGLLFATIAGWHAAYQYDAEEAARMTTEQRQREERVILEEMERQMQELKTLEQEHLRLQAEELELLRRHGVVIQLCPPDDRHMELPASYTKGKSLFFHESLNDSVFVEEKKAMGFESHGVSH